MLLIPVIGFYVWYQYEGSSFFGANEDNAPMMESVTVGPFDHIVLEQGEIESSSNNEVKCTVKAKGSSGTPILTVLPEGTMVKKGDQLCQLDSSAFEDELAAQRIAVGNNEALVISSEAAVKQAEISRQEYLDGTYLTERKSILSEIALAQQALRTSELSLASAERLAAKGTLKSLQIEAEQFSVANARNTLDAGQGRLKVLDELTKAKMLVQFDSTIETARAKLNSDRSMLEEEKNKMVEIQAQIDACTIKAPADGQVVHANKFSSRGGGSEFVVEQGAMLREQQTIFLLPDPNKMQVKAKVNESRVSLLQEGMPVRIRVGAVTDDLLGQIIKVNKYAEPGSFFSASVKEYATFIKIFDPPPTIRTGMTAEVRIFVKQITSAIQIPVHAIYETKGHYFVLKPGKAGEWETKEVKIGATNEMFVTVSEGLSETDKVVLNPRSHLDLMKIPELAETENREQLANIRNKPPEVPADGPSGGKGGPSGGGDPAAIASMIIQRVDKNGDGKISKEEASADERMASSFGSYDKNGDGSADLAEVQAYMASRVGKSRGEKGGGGKGGPRGEGSEGGPRPPGGTE
jgi:HlyD family secretion protein